MVFLCRFWFIFTLVLTGCSQTPNMSFSEKQNIQTRTYKVEKGIVLNAVTTAFEDLGYIITQKENHYISAKIETIIPIFYVNIGNTLIASASITDTEAGTKVKLNFIEVKQDSVFFGLMKGKQQRYLFDKKLYEQLFDQILQAISGEYVNSITVRN